MLPTAENELGLLSIIKTLARIEKNDEFVKFHSENVSELLQHSRNLSAWVAQEEQKPEHLFPIDRSFMAHAICLEEFGHYKSKTKDWQNARATFKTMCAMNPFCRQFELATYYEY